MEPERTILAGVFALLVAATGALVGWQEPAPAPLEVAKGKVTGAAVPWTDKHWEPEMGKLRNQELQFYSARPENVEVKDGKLLITARKESYAGADYTSASWRSKTKWTYGKFDVRAKLPRGRGLWTSIWLLGEDVAVGWPKCGEVDLVEHVGHLPNLVHFSAHTEKKNHTLKNHYSKSVPMILGTNQWHTYSLDWTDEALAWSIDGKEHYRVKREEPWPFGRPHQLIISLAVGGSWGGDKGIDDKALPATLEVESVRVTPHARAAE